VPPESRVAAGCRPRSGNAIRMAGQVRQAGGRYSARPRLEESPGTQELVARLRTVPMGRRSRVRTYVCTRCCKDVEGRVQGTSFVQSPF
jgi:hypothetical protein